MPLLILPLSMEDEHFRPGPVSAVIACCVLYQTVAQLLFPSLRIDANAVAQALAAGDWWQLEQAGLMLVRGAGGFSAVMIALFWLVFGHSLEQRLGSAVVALTYLVGSALPVPLASAGLIAMEGSYWFGLGGTLACMGLSFAIHALQEVKFFYLVAAPPYRVGFGTSTIAGLIILIFLLLILAGAQFIDRRDPKVISPPGLRTMYWCAIYPAVTWCVFLAARRLKSFSGFRVKSNSDGVLESQNSRR